MGFDKGSKSEQEINLSPEAKQALSREIGFFSSYLLPRDLNAKRGLLSEVGPEGTSPFSQALLNVSDVSKRATGKAGESAGLPSENVARAIMMQAERDPEFRSRILDFVDRVMGQTQALVDPRFAQFLRPDVETTTTQSPFQTGLQAATTLGPLAVAAFT